MLRDLRYAVRTLIQAKGWTVVILLSLALGIGANTALFSAVNGLLLTTIKAGEPDGLVRLGWYGENDMARGRSEYGFGGETADGQRRQSTFSYPAFEKLVASNESLDGMFACAPFGRVNVVADGEAEIASAFIASGSYFDVLGVPAAAGRIIGPEDDTPSATPVAMISHGYWERRFGGSRDVIGRTLRINNVTVTVVGVTPEEYGGVQGAGRDATDIHLPISRGPELGDWRVLDDPTQWWVQIMGRLKPGVTPAQVRGNLEGVFQASARDGMSGYLESLSDEERARSHNQDRTAIPHLSVDSGRRGIYDPNPDTRRNAMLLSGIVALVLLIVCANVANLLLSRATMRRHELSVRMSIGASRWRLVRQLMTESVFLAVLGGGLGLLVAYWARQLLPFGRDAPLDLRVFAFVAALSILTGLVFGLVPALRATRMDLSASLKENSRSVAGSRSLLSKGLLVLQVAVSLLLLMGAGLFLGTLRNLRSVDVGFDASNVLLFRLDPTMTTQDDEQTRALYERLQESLEGVPGVTSVSLSRSAFLGGSVSSSTVHFEGFADGDEQSAYMMTVSPEFFETLGIPLLAGRLLEDRDRDEAPPVAVVNSTLVREFLDGGEPLGQRFGFYPEDRGEIEIVGVVRDVKYAEVREDAPPTVFLPHRQHSVSGMMFLLKTASDPMAAIPAVRAAVRRVDPDLPLMQVSTQAETIEQRFEQERFFAISYSLFGGLAMLLAAIGLFGLASYSVAQRTNEIGVRMALGAQRGDVIRMILRESLVLVVVGIGVGLAATLAAGRLVESLLFGVAPLNALTMLLAGLAVIAVSTIASFLPARRASLVDPMVALQYE